MAGLRIGIDVGGTFTHGVVLRPPGDVLFTARKPTTHTAQRGVAEGVKTVLLELVGKVNPADVELVAHSTTQATNALLEGDVSPVILHVIIPPGEGFLCRRALSAESLDIGNGHFLKLHTDFTDHAAVQDWALPGDYAGKAEQLPVAVVQPLAGDAENLESTVAENWRRAGHSVVCASEITRVLGLKARARTACVNASMLPAMIATAEFTAEAVSEVLPGVPVQVVRSDGGAMSLDEMRRMPVLSLLSGPAAGASAALHRTGLSEVIFIEVGGTSTDITLIREGKVRHRYATVGGQRLMVPALDLRTVAVGGGSMLDSRERFGSRSAHKAGLPYMFQAAAEGRSIVEMLYWKEGITLNLHPDMTYMHLVAKLDDDSFAAITTTDIWLLVGDSNDAVINRTDQIERAAQLGVSLNTGQWDELNKLLQQDLYPEYDGTDTFEDWINEFNGALSFSARLIVDAVNDLKVLIPKETLRFNLIGGGGGSPVVLERVAALMSLPSQTMRDHPVISAIGAALAVTCVSQSKSVAEPTSGDIAELVSVVETRLQQQGAERVTTEFEYDPHRQVLTVTGRGNRPYDQESELLDEDGLWHKAREQLGDTAQQVWHDHQTSLWLAGEVGTQSQDSSQKAKGTEQGVEGRRQKAKSGRRRGRGGGLQALALHRTGRSLWCGTLKDWSAAESGGLEAELHRIIEQRTQYTDGGPALPGLAVVCDGRLIPLDSLGSRELIDDILRFENLPQSAGCCFLLRD